MFCLVQLYFSLRMFVNPTVLFANPILRSSIILLVFCAVLLFSNSKVLQAETEKSAQNTASSKITFREETIKDLPQIKPIISKENITSDDLGQWGDGDSFYEAIDYEINASSYLKSIDSIKYYPELSSDSLLETSWVEGDKEYGIGDYLEFKLQREYGDLYLTTLEIFNGYQKSKFLWKQNSRVKKFVLLLDNKPSAILLLNDTMQMQTFQFKKAKIDNKLNVKLVIYDVYKGTKYKDTAISEINLGGTGWGH